MAKRFLLALVVLVVGAVLATLIAIVATNGYGTAGISETVLAVGYLVLGAGGILLLAWFAAALSGRLSARLGWRTWITLPLLLLPALLIELFALPLLAIMLAELG